MSIYSTIVNCTYYDSKHLSEGTIDKKEDYSCTLCWGIAKFNKETIRFVKGSTPHAVLTEIKRREGKERTSISPFGSFIGRISKGKGYAQVDDLSKVDNSDQTFKVFEGGAFDEEIHTLGDTSDILGSLSGRESPELTRVSRVTKDYNL